MDRKGERWVRLERERESEKEARERERGEGGVEAVFDDQSWCTFLPGGGGGGFSHFRVSRNSAVGAGSPQMVVKASSRPARVCGAR